MMEGEECGGIYLFIHIVIISPIEITTTQQATLH